MKIAIITRPDNKSPKIMALSLQASLKEINIEADVLYEADMLRRLVPLKNKLRYKTNLHFRIRQKLGNLFKDFKKLNKLKEYDYIILSECVPNGFWRNYYALEELKKFTKKPLGFLEVFFLDAAPNHIQILKENGDHLQDVYDFHLALSRTSYQQTDTSEIKFEVGLNLKALGLVPYKKKHFFALIDFESENNQAIKEEQIKLLEKFNIDYVELKGTYSIPEIRQLYKEASIFLMQKYEAFGMPLAECLAYGTKVFTPDSSWPSAFRMGDQLEFYGKGKLADCFEVYDGAKDLESKLLTFQEKATKKDVSLEVFNSYLKNYPHFYVGNKKELKRLFITLTSQLNK